MTEEVKARVLLPWLKERGISPEELSLETSFSLRIGTSELEIGTRGRKDVRRTPRYSRAPARLEFVGD
jgi:hypothetical protein